MDKVINFGIPHVGEQIFESLEILDLVQTLKVSNTWRSFSEKVLMKRCKDHALEMCSLGHTDVVQLLLEHPGGENIDWNAKDFSNSYFGDTVLTLACQNGHLEVVKLLLDHSNAKQIDLSSLQQGVIKACENGHPAVVQELLQRPEGRNIDLNAYEDKHGYTILMWACQMGHANIVKLLLDHAHFDEPSKPLFLNVENSLHNKPTQS